MKWLAVIIVVVSGTLVFSQSPMGHSLWGRMFTPADNGVHIGATVEEIEKILGPAKVVHPLFGRELRQYKMPQGNLCTLIFQDGKLQEIHTDE